MTEALFRLRVDGVECKIDFLGVGEGVGGTKVAKVEIEEVRRIRELGDPDSTSAGDGVVGEEGVVADGSESIEMGDIESDEKVAIETLSRETKEYLRTRGVVPTGRWIHFTWGR